MASSRSPSSMAVSGFISGGDMGDMNPGSRLSPETIGNDSTYFCLLSKMWHLGSRSLTSSISSIRRIWVPSKNKENLDKL